MKTCSQCLAELPLEDFYGHPFGKDKKQGKCITCTKAAVKANRLARSEYYRAYDRLKAKRPGAIAKRKAYALANPRPRTKPDQEKRDARVAVGNAIRDKRLFVPPECELCSAPTDLQGHHDDYTKQLSVIWICAPCHALVHRYWDVLSEKGD